MTYVGYQPPEPVLDDTILAYQAFAGPRMGALIEPDPLGPVNKIVTLTAGDRRIKSVVCHVPVGAKATVGRDPGNFYPWLSGPSWRSGMPELEGYTTPKLPGWFIEVDGRRVLEVPEHETRPPIPPPKPVPWHRRTRRAARAQARGVLDAVAERLGYHRDDECDGGDW